MLKFELVEIMLLLLLPVIALPQGRSCVFVLFVQRKGKNEHVEAEKKGIRYTEILTVSFIRPSE